MARRFLAVGLAVLAGVATPAVAKGLMVWLLVATPLTAQANVVTTFTLTATNLDLVMDLGCLEVNVPGSGAILAAGDPQASNGDDWASTIAGNAVVVYSLTGGGRLETGETVTFTIDAKYSGGAGTWTWANHAHDREDCTGSNQPGAPIVITVTPGPTPTPVPTPTPAPTPTFVPTPIPVPTVTPTLTPLPVPTVSLPQLPSLPASATPQPVHSHTPGDTVRTDPSTSGAPSPTDDLGASAAASSVPERRAAEVAGLVPGGVGGPPSGGVGLRPASPGGSDGGTGVGLELFALLDGAHVWFVPAAAVGVPGLLVVLWVALQAVGAIAWIPAVRRMSGEEPQRRRPRPRV